LLIVSRVSPVQTNFNAGVISRRLQARADLNLYDIAVAAGTGWVPLVEGGLDACPGLIHVAQAAGPCRLIPFEYNVTQGYVVEMSAGKARFYTNDTRIETGGGDPVELVIPYDKPAIDALMWEQSYDVLYLFHGAWQTQELSRTAADAFDLNPLELKNGPFEDRNDDETVSVYASAVSGDVTLHAQQAGEDYALFTADDVGGLFQIEADDFGDISSWEPGITVTLGQLLTWNERVYRVAGGSGRTGTVAPIHTEGVEWDGIGQGQDLNNKAAGGVQLEFICDRFGTLRITGFTDGAHVNATVIRRLPFTATNDVTYTYTGGYYDGDWDDYVPPENSVTYQYGTWRWRFGAFSNRRGWPNCGVVWNERLVLARGARWFCSVAGSLNDFSTYNELGEISADMAFQGAIKDANGIVSMVADDKLLMLTASGMFALGPSNTAVGIGPTNFRVDRQNNEGGSAIMPVQLDGLTIYIGKSKRRVIEGGYAPERDKQEAIDLTRYARFIGQPRFTALASLKDPNRLIAACRGDGSLAFAAYVPSEQVLGWFPRKLAPGLLARDCASITDPTGELNQLWVAAEFGGAWHVLRMGQFRQEDDPIDPPMVDMAFQYEGAPDDSFSAPLLANQAVQVQADGALYRAVQVDGAGNFTLNQPAARVDVGIAFDAYFTTLPGTAGSDNGSALGKMRRITQLLINVLNSRGLAVEVQGNPARDIEQLYTDSTTDQGFAPFTGFVLLEDCGEHDRLGQITVRRVAPAAATVRAVRPMLDMQQS
jgi:hypothetical protein